MPHYLCQSNRPKIATSLHYFITDPKIDIVQSMNTAESAVPVLSPFVSDIMTSVLCQHIVFAAPGHLLSIMSGDIQMKCWSFLEMLS